VNLNIKIPTTESREVTLNQIEAMNCYRVKIPTNEKKKPIDIELKSPQMKKKNVLYQTA
jgi:hypothetical protein